MTCRVRQRSISFSFIVPHFLGTSWEMRLTGLPWQSGEPVRFNAVQFGKSAWYASGPVAITAPETLANAGWTVSTDIGKAPIIVEPFGHPLAQGQDFALPVTGTVIGCVLRD